MSYAERLFGTGSTQERSAGLVFAYDHAAPVEAKALLRVEVLLRLHVELLHEDLGKIEVITLLT